MLQLLDHTPPVPSDNDALTAFQISGELKRERSLARRIDCFVIRGCVILTGVVRSWDEQGTALKIAAPHADSWRIVNRIKSDDC